MGVEPRAAARHDPPAGTRTVRPRRPRPSRPALHASAFRLPRWFERAEEILEEQLEEGEEEQPRLRERASAIASRTPYSSRWSSGPRSVCSPSDTSSAPRHSRGARSRRSRRRHRDSGASSCRGPGPRCWVAPSRPARHSRGSARCRG
jgi:hypothetical protein